MFSIDAPALSSQNFPFAQGGVSLCNSLRMPLAVLSPTQWQSEGLCHFSAHCFDPLDYTGLLAADHSLKINTCVWESL